MFVSPLLTFGNFLNFPANTMIKHNHHLSSLANKRRVVWVEKFVGHKMVSQKATTSGDRDLPR